MRAAAAGEDLCWEVMHSVSSKASYLGIQVATRKTRPPSRRPGPWAGSVVEIHREGIGVKVAQDKWDKIKTILAHTLELIEAQSFIPLKLLESYRGSLVYVQRTYPVITPYLKGYHLTIDSWRHDRDQAGWRLPKSQPLKGDYPAAPTQVFPVPRLLEDVRALLSLFDSPVPPTRFVRAKFIKTAIYGYADASESGFGSTLGTASALFFSHGIWTEAGSAMTSNYRELENLVCTLEQGVESGQLHHTEVWLFTDNSTLEAVFWKGHSSSSLLNGLILRLRKLEMSGLLRIHMVHIPGTRMIAQGTDGLSRGDLTDGVMTGLSILDFVPLNKSAMDRQPGILPWLRTWIPAPDPFPLTIADWFDVGHGTMGGTANSDGVWFPIDSPHKWLIWSPPPALAETALDELEEARHKRKDLNHIWIMPRLLAYCWRKRLCKICDLVFSIPPGARTFWPVSEQEPLVIGLTLCFSTSSPWQVKFTTGVLDVERPCLKCGQLRTAMNGIFCANFATPRSRWQACHSMWCGSCYTPSDTVTFHRM